MKPGIMQIARIAAAGLALLPVIFESQQAVRPAPDNVTAFSPRGTWTRFGGDAQRTGWNKFEVDLTPANIKNLKLQWSVHLESESKGLQGLTVPIARPSTQTQKGFRDLVVVAGAAGQVFVLDAETGATFWQKTVASESKPTSADSWLCHNGINATPLIAPAPPGSSTGGQALFVLAPDGRLHTFGLVSGEELLPAAPFLPPFAKAWSLNLLNNVVYTSSSQGCNGAKSGVWSIDLADPARKPSFFPSGAGIWGRAGPAMTAAGSIVVETGDGVYDTEKDQFADSILLLSAKDLRLMDYYTPENRSWITRKDLDMGSMSTTVFPFKSWELIAAAGKEGVIYLLDAKSLGGADHRTPLYRSPLLANDEVNYAGKGFWGAFSTWEDAGGARWLYAPAWGPPGSAVKFPLQYGPIPNGSLMAFRVETKNDKPVLVPAWDSIDMSLPTPPVIANGMVFVLSDGDDGAQVSPNATLLSVNARKSRASHAILYVLDASTGKVMFNSGDAIRGFSHFSGLTVSGGRVFVGTYDGSLYSFGL
jgi:outer membrane protein assembly factor BamB